jgi:hypothetical protein
MIEMAFEMARDARKVRGAVSVPRSRTLTQQLDASSIVLRIGWICTGYSVAKPSKASAFQRLRSSYPHKSAPTISAR